MDLFCPVTGLRVLSRSEWNNKNVSDTFAANFSIIGNSIIYSIPSGKADLTGVQNSATLKKEIAQLVSDNNGPYIQIQDYANLNGSTQAARRYFVNKANEDNRLLAMIFCNLSTPLSIAVKIGKRFNTAGKNIHIARHYEDAIKLALELCNQHNLKQNVQKLDQNICFDKFDKSLSPIELISDNAWDIQTPGYTNRSVIINRSILHSTSEGYLDVEHIPLIEQMRYMCQEALPKGSSIKHIVVNSSQLKGGSRKARTQYMQSLKDWYQQFPFQMYIIYGVNPFMLAAAHLARPFMPFKVKIVQDFNRAFDIIRADKSDETAKKKKREEADPPDPNREILEELLAFIGGINWEQEGLNSSVSKDKQHPFYILFQSIKLIKEELDSLIADHEKSTVALQNSNTQLKTALSELKQTQKKIVQQERMAAVGQLAAGIAHDFNNILTIISGSAEMMQMSTDNPTLMQSSLQRITVSSQRAAHLVHQLLDFSRKTIRQPKQFDLASFTKESVKFFKRTIPENIQINLNLEPGKYLIEADPTQIQQVITNLALNARDAMPFGGELWIGLSLVEHAENIRCMLCSEPIEGEWVQLTVTDTGSGISTDVLPRIFEPFFTTKDVSKGTGLGLSQVSGIVEQHQGHIWVDSHVNKRTTFTIYLPVILVQDEEKPEAEVTQIRQGQGETILLTDDEPIVLETTAAMLEHLGYQTISAPNGEKAFSIYKEHKTKIALVLSDIVMPDMDGVTLFHHLRVENPNVKMVMMSGYPLEEKSAKLLEMGIVSWFEKPISLEQLSHIVAKALSK